MTAPRAASGSLILVSGDGKDAPRDLHNPDECEPVRHADYGSGAYEDVADAFDADGDVLAANLGWE